MPIHHKFLNAVYDRPFYLVAALGVPFVGYVLKENMKLTHLTFSQKIMHSRVMGQMGVISILLTTMAFKEYMDKVIDAETVVVLIHNQIRAISFSNCYSDV